MGGMARGSGGKRRLEIEFLGDAKSAVSAMDQVDRRAGGLGGSLGKMGKAGALAIAGIGMAGIAAGGMLLSVANEFDAAFDTIRIQTGATGDELEGLKGNFRDVLAAVPASSEDASAAIAGLNQRLGLTGPHLVGLSNQMLELSRITGTDLTTNIESTTRAFGDWGVEANAQGDTLDYFFKVSQQTGIGVDDLANKMVTFGAPLRQMGFGLEESAALFGKFEAEGVNAELVMGSMRQALGRMAKAGEPAVETFGRVTDEIANAGSVSEANALAMELFGAKAGPDMAAAIREGRFEVDDLTASLDASGDTILGVGAETQDMGEKFTLLKNRVFLALEPVAMALFDALGRGMDRLGPIVENVVGWFEGLKEVFDGGGFGAVVSRVGDQIAAAWPTVSAKLAEFGGMMLTWIGEQIPPLLERLQAWGQAFVEWIGPQIPPLLEQLGALMGDVATWALEEGLPMLIEKVQEWGDALIAWVGPMIPPLLGKLGELLGQLTGWVITTAVPALAAAAWHLGGAMLGWLVDLVPVALRGLGSLLTGIGGWIVGTAIPGVAGAAAGIAGAMLGWIGDAAGSVAGMLGGVLDPIVDGVAGLGGRIADVAGNAFDGLWQAFRSAVNLIIDGWNSLSFSIPGFDPPGPGSFGGVTISTPHIGRLHEGGAVPLPPGVEGQATVLGGEFMLSRRDVDAILRGQRGGSTTVQVYLDGRMITEQVTTRQDRQAAAAYGVT